MTTKQADFAKRVLQHEDRLFVLTALSLVNLGDEEQEILEYRYMRKHTQSDTAEKMDCSENHVYGVQQQALEKCYKVWHRHAYVKAIINATP